MRLGGLSTASRTAKADDCIGHRMTYTCMLISCVSSSASTSRVCMTSTSLATCYRMLDSTSLLLCPCPSPPSSLSPCPSPCLSSCLSPFSCPCPCSSRSLVLVTPRTPAPPLTCASGVARLKEHCRAVFVLCLGIAALPFWGTFSCHV